MTINILTTQDKQNRNSALTLVWQKNALQLNFIVN